MPVKSRGASMFEKIRQTQIYFINMSSSERIRFINRYENLMPYQITGLFQCKKIMTPAEKKALKTVVENSKVKNENSADENVPQPM